MKYDEIFQFEKNTSNIHIVRIPRNNTNTRNQILQTCPNASRWWALSCNQMSGKPVTYTILKNEAFEIWQNMLTSSILTRLSRDLDFLILSLPSFPWHRISFQSLIPFYTVIMSSGNLNISLEHYLASLCMKHLLDLQLHSHFLPAECWLEYVFWRTYTGRILESESACRNRRWCMDLSVWNASLRLKNVIVLLELLRDGSKRSIRPLNEMNISAQSHKIKPKRWTWQEMTRTRAILCRRLDVTVKMKLTYR